MERNDFIENFIGGACAVVAVGAAVAEMFVNGISSETLTACVKDVFGSLAIVVLFFALVKDKIPARNFREAFYNAMNPICKKYNPLIRKEEVSENAKNADTKVAYAKKDKLNKAICYEMASDLNVIFNTQGKEYRRFLEIENTDTTIVKLLVRKTFFDCPNFSEATLYEVGNKIKSNLTVNFPNYQVKFDDKKNELLINTNRVMKTKKDAFELSNLIDSAVILYIAESKK
jgi:hypothetical protein